MGTTEIIILVIEIVVLIVLIYQVFYLVYERGYERGYKKGQLDSEHGEEKYTLVEFKDGTREYYKKTELKDLSEHKIVES